MKSMSCVALLALLAILASPAMLHATSTGTRAPSLPRRSLLQDAAPQTLDIGAPVQATPAPDAPDDAAAAASAAATASFPSTEAFAPDAPDASIGEALSSVPANAADSAAAAAAAAAPADGGSSRLPSILAVPGDGLGAAAAVVPAATTQIIFYQYCFYLGRSGMASAGNYPSMPQGFDNFIASVRVPAGMTATFYTDANYKGRALKVTGPSNVPCFALWIFNRLASSMKITVSGSGGNGGVDAQLLALINATRRQNGLTDLSIDARLNNAASAHSVDQAARQVLDHYGENGSTPGQRITSAGYSSRAWGENVGEGQTSAQSVFDAWMASPTHRANILGDFVHMGAAYATGGNGKMYWTLDLASPW